MPTNTCSWNIAGTKFFRLSSKKLLGRWGTNLQNPSDNICRIYIPNENKKFVQADQAGADALIVAYLLPNGNFRSLFLSGIKPHIFVALHIFHRVWKNEFSFFNDDWLKFKPSELVLQPNWKTIATHIKKDKQRYFIGKKCCHSFNYRMTASTFRSDVLEASGGLVVISKQESEYFYEVYHSLSPEISSVWWPQTENQVRTTRTLYNLFGYPLTFYGPITPALLREATACVPASTVAIINNIAETKLQEWINQNPDRGIDILNNKHDSLLVQCSPEDEVFTGNLLKSFLEQDLESPRGEKFKMKAEVKSGWNWGDYHEENNPNGMKDLNV